jgi:hypothetical protein
MQNRNNQQQFLLASLTRNTAVAVARYEVVPNGHGGHTLLLLAIVAAAFRDGDDYYELTAKACDEAFQRQIETSVVCSAKVARKTTELPRVQVRLHGGNDFTREMEALTPGGAWFAVSFAKGATTSQTEATMRQLHSETWRVARGAASMPFIPTMSEEGECVAVARPTALSVLHLAGIQGGVKDLNIVEDGREYSEVQQVLHNAERIHQRRMAPPLRLDKIREKLSPEALAALNAFQPEDLALLTGGGGKRRHNRRR